MVFGHSLCRSMVSGDCEGYGDIELALLAYPGIVEARVLDMRSVCRKETSVKRIAYVAGPGACRLSNKSLPLRWQLDALVPVNRLGNDTELEYLPVWTAQELDQIRHELISLSDVEDVAVVSVPNSVRKHIRQSLLVPNRVKASTPFSLREPSGVSKPVKSVEVGHSLSEQLAVLHGPSLVFPKNFPRTIGEGIQRAASNDKTVIYGALNGTHRHEKYASLYQRALSILGGLQNAQIGKGDCVLLDSSNAEDFMGALWACILGGIIVTPIGVPEANSNPATFERLNAAWQLLDHPTVLTKATLPSSFGNDTKSVKTLDISRLQCPEACNLVSCESVDSVLILLTSGSTGIPKGVHLSHAAILAMAVGFGIDGLKVNETDIFFNWMPLDHVGALVWSSLVPMLAGCDQIHTSTDYILADSSRWLDFVSDFRVSRTWAPNFAYSLIARAALAQSKPWDVSSLRTVLNAGEAVNEESLKQFLEVLKIYGVERDDIIVPTFGMSETCSGIVLGKLGQTLGSLSSLGSPVAGSSLRIVNSQQQVVKEGEIGNLQIASPQLFSRYHGFPDRASNCHAARDWFDTGDAGLIANGNLYLTGRSNDKININGVTIFAFEVEQIVASLSGIDSNCVAAVPFRSQNSTTDEIVLFFSMIPEMATDDDSIVAELVKAIRNTLSLQLGLVIETLLLLSARDFPRTGIGKISKTKLRQNWEAGVYDAIQERVNGLLGSSDYSEIPLHRQIWVERPVRLKEPTVINPANIDLIFVGNQEQLQWLVPNPHDYQVQIIRSSETKRLSNNTWAIASDDAIGHGKVIDAIATLDGKHYTILHAWGYNDSADSTVHATRSLLSLARAIATRGKKTYSVVVLTYGAVATNPDERINYNHALLPGLIRSLALELPEVRWQLIDLPMPSFNDVSVILKGFCGFEPVVAWRDGKALVPRFEVVEPPLATLQEAITPGSLWLISGGLGGLGSLICERLLSHGANVLLIGRTDNIDLSPERAARLKQLERLGDVQYIKADVADLDQLRDAVHERECALGQSLSGILHAAGSGRAVRLADDNGVDLETMQRTSLGGLAALATLLETRPAAQLLVIGSIVGQVGGRVMGYAAVHAALSEAAHKLTMSGARVSLLSCSSWMDIGLSKGQTNEALVRSDGLVPLDAETGLLVIEAALLRPGTHWLVGLNDQHPANAAFALTTPAPLNRPTAWVKGKQSAVVLSYPDNLSRQAWVLVRNAPEILRDAQGQVDIAGMISHATDRWVAPRDGVERLVAETFSSILGIDQPSIYDNFFMLGGTSLLASQLSSQLSELFFVELSSASIFQNPTIESLTIELYALEKQEGLVSAVAKHLESLRSKTN